MGNSYNKTHGMRFTKIYSIWCNIKSRCNNKNGSRYKYYGGRGITYDPRREKFEEFYADMGATYKDGLSIERIDVNGNYCRENCCRITMAAQAKNKRCVDMIEYKGKTQTIVERANELGIKYFTLNKRLHRYNYDIEKAMEKKHKITDDQVREIRNNYKGLCGEQTRLGKQYGLSQCTISAIIRRTIYKNIF